MQATFTDRQNVIAYLNALKNSERGKAQHVHNNTQRQH